jgi:hypothetical protein
MSDKYDLKRLIEESAAGMPPGADGVPLLGQQVPMFNGLPVNGRVMTLDEIEALTERQFRELMIACVVNLMGAMYVPSAPVEATEPEDASASASMAASLDSE